MVRQQDRHDTQERRTDTAGTCAHEMPFAPRPLEEGGYQFRLWAPSAGEISLIVDGSIVSMSKNEDGWFSTIVEKAAPGSRYQFIVDGDLRVPDPASRYQPEDVHGPSQIIDPDKYKWSNSDWSGRTWEETVIYEMHVGAFTPEGTFQAAIEKLDHLVELGITAIELMPLADFPGEFNWGYDGVLLYAPDASYGTPDDLKALIDEAHKRKLQVFIDVVYNHFGPKGNYLHVYAKNFFNNSYHTPWGAAVNYDGEGSRIVRDFVVHNVLYWLEEYRFDGLRFDAVDTIYDSSQKHILTEIAEAVHNGPGKYRHVHLILENGANDSELISGGKDKKSKFTAQWNDDMHHALHVIGTGEESGYYADFCDEHSEDPAICHLGRCLAEGFSYQGQIASYFKSKPRGKKSKHLPAGAFINFIQNHDQIGNRALGERISHLCEMECARALTATVMLAPSTPMLFMGDEWGASTTWVWFADFSDELAESVRNGRLEEFSRFKDFQDPEKLKLILDPTEKSTFDKVKLDWSELEEFEHAQWLAFQKELLQARARVIRPILDKIAPGMASWMISEEGLLEVVWQLMDGGELKFLANLSDQGAASPMFSEKDFDERKIIFQTPSNAALEMDLGTVPPWTVIWLLENQSST